MIGTLCDQSTLSASGMPTRRPRPPYMQTPCVSLLGSRPPAVEAAATAASTAATVAGELCTPVLPDF
jgi:hypothetical protein